MCFWIISDPFFVATDDDERAKEKRKKVVIFVEARWLSYGENPAEKSAADVYPITLVSLFETDRTMPANRAATSNADSNAQHGACAAFEQHIAEIIKSRNSAK